MKYIFLGFILLTPVLTLGQTTKPPADTKDTLQTPSIIHQYDEPQSIRTIAVPYPPEARKAQIEGNVTFSALIDTNWKVKEVIIDYTDNEIFRQPVIDAIKKYLFKPARQDHKKVEAWYKQTISFKLRHNAGY